MDLGIRGRHAIVCAASKGLGRAAAFSLAREGVALTLIARTRETLEATAAEIRAETGATVNGYVVDGGSRDTDLVLEQGFPVFCAFLTPADIVERWVPHAYGEPIDIGGVTIRSGDYLLADRDGVVIIPAGIAEAVVTKTEEVVATESDMRRALVAGMDPVQAYLKYGKF